MKNRTHHIDQKDLANIVNALVEHPSLTRLNLEGNRIGSAGINSLAIALKVNPGRPLTVKLRNSGLGPNDAESLANLLSFNTRIEELDLGLNDLGDEGAAILTRAFANNTSLKKINLYENKIGPKGTRAIAKALTHNQTLQTLVLNSNPIGKGLRDLAKLFAVNDHLTRLELNLSHISEADIQFLAQTLHTNIRVPKSITLGSKRFTRASASVLLELLKNNRLLLFSPAASSKVPKDILEQIFEQNHRNFEFQKEYNRPKRPSLSTRITQRLHRLFKSGHNTPVTVQTTISAAPAMPVPVPEAIPWGNSLRFYRLPAESASYEIPDVGIYDFTAINCMKRKEWEVTHGY